MGAEMLRCAQDDSKDTGQVRLPGSLISKCLTRKGSVCYLPQSDV
jgi:hypothetical protein